jgi:predicted porin
MKKYIVAVLIFLLFAVKTYAASDYTVTPSLSLSEEYNDNILLTRSARISDFITYISPGIDLSARSINSALKLDYSPTFSFYRSHNELNETAHRFTANGTFTLSEKLSSTLTGSFVKSSESSDIRDIPNIGPVTVHAEWKYLTIGGGASYKLRDNLFYTLNLSYFSADTNAPDLNKVKTYSGNMGLTYRTSERTTLSANASYIKYDNRPASDATGQTYLLGVTHSFSPTVTIGASAGAIITKIQDTGESDIGFGGGVNLRKTYETGEINLSYNHNVIPSVESDTPLRSQTVSLRLLKHMSTKFGASLSASYGNFKSIKTDRGDTNKTDTNEINFNSALTYSFSPAVNLILSYNYVDSNDKLDNNRDFHNQIVLLTLRLSYNKKL